VPDGPPSQLISFRSLICFVSLLLALIGPVRS
jgi:hypothetical protein